MLSYRSAYSLFCFPRPRCRCSCGLLKVPYLSQRISIGTIHNFLLQRITALTKQCLGYLFSHCLQEYCRRLALPFVCGCCRTYARARRMPSIKLRSIQEIARLLVHELIFTRGGHIFYKAIDYLNGVLNSYFVFQEQLVRAKWSRTLSFLESLSHPTYPKEQLFKLISTGLVSYFMQEQIK